MSFLDLICSGFGPLNAFIAVVFFYDLFIFYKNVIVKYFGDPFMPYFSSTASEHFQSCVFAICGNISAFLICVMVFVKYRQMRSIFYQQDMGYLLYWNNIAKWFGYLSAMGLFVISNVEGTAIIPVHMPAAFVMIGGFLIYMIFQCYFTYITSPVISLYTVFTYRAVCTAMAALCFVISFVCGITAFTIFHNKYPDLPTPRSWDTWDGPIYLHGSEFYIISAVAEWLCATFQLIFMISFEPEFETISLQYFLSSDFIDQENRDFFIDRNRYRV
ncbi:hypothetical protein GCK72_025553 [Caenorhabditis remanei]|uniref:CWH43-like N-terminal domain-containing protein n=1 Tax=Caenorhabditis remanei TaxID=31234 RepID=A0A6A5G2C7_CAERE|nr:hypothetical protein GCK72_025553 [Caenorhabditis remanei]KAF1749086.1 hypothetical protein GCK72_025553 [Caenorhabditis remanei]